MRRLCVFCGSSPGGHPDYLAAAAGLGRLLAQEGLGLVYGGASVGLMGAVADAALDAGAEVTGVIPQALVDREIAHPRVGDLRVVGSMHERKAVMAELSDGFITLPGGLGTMEELFEILTWNILGIYDKPCALLNVNGYYDGLELFLDHAAREGFVLPDDRAARVVSDDPEVVLDSLE